MAITTIRLTGFSVIVAAMMATHVAAACSTEPEPVQNHVGIESAPQLTLLRSLHDRALPTPDKDEQIDDAARQLVQLDQDEENRRIIQRQVNGLLVDVLFASDDTAISDSDRQRIRIVAELLMQFETASVSIIGYADQRGSESYNDTLSLDRAFEVADILNDLGVSQHQINTVVMGKAGAKAAPGDIDAYASDRRASLLVEISSEPEVTSEFILSDVVHKGTD